MRELALISQRSNAESKRRYLESRSLDLDSYLHEVQRRKRAECPGPEPVLQSLEETMSSPASSPPTSFQPINPSFTPPLPRSAEPRARSHDAESVDSMEIIHPPTLSSERFPAEGTQPTRVDVATNLPSSGVDDAARPSIPDRDWKVISILEKRRRSGIVEHLVQWAASKHPSSVIQQSHEGQWTVDIAGVQYEVAGRTASSTDTNDEPLELITWKPSWHFDWELPKGSVAQFEVQLGEVKTDPQETLEPSWWKWGEYTDWYCPPEPEPHSSKTKCLSLEYLDPEVDSDYTISFLEQIRQYMLTEGDRSKPSQKAITTFLNMRIRQRLQFPADLCGEGRTLFLERDERVHALLVYIFRMANVVQCKCCIDQPGPFPKCVNWMGGTFAGACVNCVFKRQRSQCDYHLRSKSHSSSKPALLTTTDFSQKLPEIARQSQLANMLDSDSSSSPSEPRSIDFRSSVELHEHDDRFTPASSIDGGSGDLPDLGMPADAVPTDSISHDFRDKRKTPSMDADPVNESLPDDSATHSVKRQLVEDNVPPDNQAVKTDDDVDEHVPKRQRQSPVGFPPMFFEHKNCNGSRNAPCTDPVVGAVAPSDPAAIVFCNQEFRPGQATNDQVHFIISRSDCAAAEQLDETWQKVRSKHEERGIENRWSSKENYISHRRWRLLNELIREFCPWPGHGEHFDLTGDD
ncbi:hypothetical protein PRZ48_008739 [Zasmidium cellare]|uniref:Uncharacterized protein n=1 Tax=Zasmidium cellare TaxID=395010 RepID=A0ABR0EHC7_ZASCE|nr:hypothetical protein PRZ48_008739 [Zasmidium cellare]